MTLERLQSIAIGSLARGRRRQGGGPAEIPAALVAGGEPEVGEKREEVTADLLGVLGERKEGRRGERDGSQGRRRVSSSELGIWWEHGSEG